MTNALIDMTENLSSNINDNKQNLAMFLDLSTAFNCVNRNTLDRKLELYKFLRGSRDLLSSYLSFRSQCVSVQGKNCKYKWIKTGVP